ncbi:hypothetical protein MNBD_GAMMA23-583 [hydrothermal vent metagenome]|uniref:Starvation lipoprotein Slp paralog n=1 Tax=hydrothermal vent metagenome TaxID=652676 RepID=A0A3B0ZVS5_9ZZZZ
MKKLFALLIVTLIISGCATPPLEISRVNKSLTLAMALDRFDNMSGQYALWGGAILSGKNLAKTTELEILAYPLDGYAEPIKNSKSFGRFILVKDGYLELGEYSKGRLVTVVGELTGKREGKVGHSQYIYPVLEVQQIKIWPEESRYYYDDSDVRFHFGVGIFHRF